ALTNREQARLDPFRSADRVPAAIEEKDTGPGGEPVGHQCGIVTEQVAPAEARAFQQVDLRHDEIAERNVTVVVVDAFEDKTAERAFLTAERDVRLALRAAFGRDIAGSINADEIDLLLERA